MDHTLDHTFESANRVYDKEQLCPTIPTCAGGNIQPKVIEETRCIGGLSADKWGKQYHQQDRVYKGDIALAQPANLPEGSYKYIVAMRGRNPEHPTDRTKGLHLEQRLEMNTNGTVNTLTTVQKDNLVLEEKNCKLLGMLGNEGFEKVRRVDSTEAMCPTVSTKEDRIKIMDERIQKVGQISSDGSQCGTVVNESGRAPTLSAGTHGYGNAHVLTGESVEIKQATKDGSIECAVGGCFDASFPESKTRRGLVHDHGNVTPTLTASNSEQINFVETQYRIRKLTPLECWRLMGYTDTDFHKAHNARVSNSNLYKQAGNAIVKQVLMAIFSQMNIKGVKPWNE